MWLTLAKYLIYTSFALNVACGIWVFFGIFQWVGEMKKNDK